MFWSEMLLVSSYISKSKNTLVRQKIFCYTTGLVSHSDRQKGSRTAEKQAHAHIKHTANIKYISKKV